MHSYPPFLQRLQGEVPSCSHLTFERRQLEQAPTILVWVEADGLGERDLVSALDKTEVVEMERLC